MRQNEMDTKRPVEKLQAFLEIDDAEIACMSVQDLKEEVRQLGLDPEGLSTSLKKKISETLEQSRIKTDTPSSSEVKSSGDGTNRGRSLERKRGGFVSRVSQRLRIFFQFFSKTDQAVVDHCSNVAVMSQTSIGLLVLVNGVFALISGSYAIYTTFQSIPVAVIIGILFSLVILFFDREIVSSPNKFAAIPRLLLAVFIGIVVSVPLELRLFESRINEQLHRTSVSENRAALDQWQKTGDMYDTKIAAIERDMREYREGLLNSTSAMEDETLGAVRNGKSRTGKAGQGPAFAQASRLKESYERLLYQAESQLEELKNSRNREQQRAFQENKSLLENKSSDLLARHEALGTIQSSSMTALYMIWGVRLLFILFQLLPILAKLLMPATDYDALLEAERRKAIARVNAIANDQLGQIIDDPYSVPLPIISARLSTVKEQVKSSLGQPEQALTA